jgi:hypothetical protein
MKVPGGNSSEWSPKGNLLALSFPAFTIPTGRTDTEALRTGKEGTHPGREILARQV